jgi:predicted branched-subunit amino acid permease
VDVEALRDVAPVLIGIAPFAMVIGVTLGRLEIPYLLGIAASGLIYAGSAQLAAMDLLGAGAATVTVLLTMAVVNARMLMYGASLEPMFRGQPACFRWLGPHFIVDQTYTLAMNRPDVARDSKRFRRYWLTIGGAIGVVWLATIGTAMALGSLTGPHSPLAFAATALFIGMLVPKLAERRALITAGAAALVAGTAGALPHGLGLVAGIVAGMVVGSIGERRPS